MKKRMCKIILICLMIGLSSNCTFASSLGPSIFVDGILLHDAKATISETGRTLAPLRAVFESMGASVVYDSVNRSIIAQRGETEITLSIDADSAMVDGKLVSLDAPAQIIDGRTMVPLRFVAMAMGATVNWDEENRIVAISTKAIESSILPSRGDSGTYTRKFEWSSMGYNWWITLEIDKSHYQYYKNRQRLSTRDYSLYVSDPSDDGYMSNLVRTFRDLKEKNGLSDAQTVQSIIAFVQSLEYRLDADSTGYDEYPKYPLETLVDMNGDCEDSSILLASLLREMGYGAVLLNPPGHMAVGVKGSDTIPGTYYLVDGIRYYYVETTGPNWSIGKLPEQYKGEKVLVLQLDPKPLISFTFQAEGDTIYATVRNDGTYPANNLFVYAYLDAGDNMIYGEAYSTTQTIPARGEVILPVQLSMPSGVNTRLVIQVVSQGKAVSEYKSDWIWLP